MRFLTSAASSLPVGSAALASPDSRRRTNNTTGLRLMIMMSISVGRISGELSLLLILFMIVAKDVSAGAEDLFDDILTHHVLRWTLAEDNAVAETKDMMRVAIDDAGIVGNEQHRHP